MESTSKILAVKVTCGKVTCGDCEWHRGEDEDGECLMFGRYLVDGIVRCAECLEAEKLADEMMLEKVLAKAETQQGQ